MSESSTRIEASRKLVNFDGKEIIDQNGDSVTIGSALSLVLLADKKRDALKLYVLARKLHDEEEVDLDPADLRTVRECAEETTYFITNLIKGQLLDYLSSLKNQK